jgi:hypothetical protein
VFQGMAAWWMCDSNLIPSMKAHQTENRRELMLKESSFRLFEYE